MRDLSIKLGAGALLFLLIGAAPAAAQRFALTCIGTQTGDEVHFQYRWGSDEPWTQASVKPDEWRTLTFKYEYAGENSSPQLQVRYDDDLSSESNLVVSDLESYAAKNRYCEAEGKTYNFYQRGQELYLNAED